MTAGTLNLVMEKGAKFDYTFTCKDENDAVVDLTGYSARMQVREVVDSSVTLAEYTTANGKLSISAVLGQITLSLAASETTTYEFTDGVYDLEIYTDTITVCRLLEGTVTVKKNVTR